MTLENLTSIIMKKIISISLLTIFLLQSCVVYQKTPVPIEQAYDKGKIKVVNTLGSEFVFKSMALEGETYIGIDGKDRIIIDATQVSAIYLKDIKKSKMWTILLAISPAIVFVVYGAIFWATGANLWYILLKDYALT